MTNLFHKIEGGVAILRKQGVYRQCDVYKRGDTLYARWGTGFIILYKDGTSCALIHLDGLELPSDMVVTHNTFGKKVVLPPMLVAV